MDKLIVANWKLQFSHTEAIDWLTLHLDDIRKAVDHTDHELVLCPSFTELPFALSSYPDQFWGAQDCAPEELGAYTGQVSALSLSQMGVRFCIVGHSERRTYQGETNEAVRRKTALLLEHEIYPIVCIGETELQKTMKHEVLKEQLSAVLDLYTEHDTAIIAYEPIWSIGTGLTPTHEELTETIDFLRSLTAKQAPLLLYGGSVTPSLATSCSNFVDGYLVGSASGDPEVLKKIILSC